MSSLDRLRDALRDLGTDGDPQVVALNESAYHLRVAALELLYLVDRAIRYDREAK